MMNEWDWYGLGYQPRAYSWIEGEHMAALVKVAYRFHTEHLCDGTAVVGPSSPLRQRNTIYC